MRWLAVFLALMFFAPAVAEDAPKFSVDMTATLTDWDGRPIKDAFQATQSNPPRPDDDPACLKCDDLTLGTAIVRSMLLVLRGDEAIEGGQRWAWEDKAKAWRKDPAAKLTGREQTIIGDRLIKVYANLPNGSVVIGAAMPLIDPNRKPPELK